MDAREVDLLVAQRVFGLKLDDEDSRLVRVPVDHPSCPPGTTLGNSPKPYVTDANADCSVLVRVRETWTTAQQGAFRNALEDSWTRRTRAFQGPHPYLLMCYEPGDYAKAALAALAALPPETSGTSKEKP
jgi:hypothetical protein